MAADRPARPSPLVALLVAAAVVYSISRVAGSARAWLVPVAVTLTIAVTVAVSPDIASGKPLADPLGYANANAALLVQGVVAAGMWMAVVHHRGSRVVPAALGLALAAVTVQTGSSAGVSLAAIAVAAAVIVLWRAPVRTAVLIAAGAAAAALLVTIAVGGAYRSPRHHSDAVGAVAQTLSSRRAALWHDALALTRDDPIRGVGPGRFEVASPTASSDRDTRWAHSLFLQQAAETGLVGVLLLVGLVTLVFAQLWRSRGSPAARVLGAVSVAALLMHGAIDYIAHFPAIPLAVAALAGSAAVTAGRSPRRSTPERESPG